ncbi:DUF2809 domain-containing protein [Hymenobacter sp. 5317J-9]|uniref:ribosomal maturation YjgA family protein n=1 Tax=Hymenobacter sp. 5317J-9 TaxID=2932250 RepID=UPI001FD6715B|nr:DUF2809 domain-containing protein [Hymenobacter sp. 5317J-9]UOQ99529.1 DUF2809 domain-containing protein [Hymenobacter sp. 5317J-9]
MLTFRSGYFWAGVGVLLVEIIIARYVHDALIRPYFGDMLAVVLVYCFLRSVLKAGVLPLAGLALLVACAVEAGQYFHLLRWLGLQHSALARVVLGTAFSWLDLLTYAAGVAAILGAEKLRAADGEPASSPF